MKEDVAKLGCRNWTVAVRNRKGWTKLLKEAEAHPGLKRHWKKKRMQSLKSLSKILIKTNNVRFHKSKSICKFTLLFYIFICKPDDGP